MHWILLFHSFLFGANYSQAPVFFTYDEKLWEIVDQAKPKKVQDSLDAKMAGKTIVTLQRKNSDEKYRARFSIVVDSLEKVKEQGGEPLHLTYARYARKFLEDQRFSVLETRTLKIGDPQREVSDTLLFQRDFGLKFRQLISVDKGKVYLITFTSRLKPFDDYAKEIEALLSSLTFS